MCYYEHNMNLNKYILVSVLVILGIFAVFYFGYLRNLNEALLY
jgi:hypothetical protein